MHTRRAATFVFAAVAAAALIAGCSPSQEPADPASTTPAEVTAAPEDGQGEDQNAQAEPTPTTVENNGVVSVEVSDGEVEPAAGPVDVAAGSTIVVEVTSDTAGQVVVSGYNRAMTLTAEQPGRMVLTVNTAGEFPVELQGADGPLPLFTLRVN